MSEEEKKAIERFKYCEIELAQEAIEEIKKDAEKNKIPYKNIEGYIESFNNNIRKAETILNLIEKQDKMIDLMAETMALDIMYADEDKDTLTMKEKIKKHYREWVQSNEK